LQETLKRVSRLKDPRGHRHTLSVQELSRLNEFGNKAILSLRVLLVCIKQDINELGCNPVLLRRHCWSSQYVLHRAMLCGDAETGSRTRCPCINPESRSKKIGFSGKDLISEIRRQNFRRIACRVRGNPTTRHFRPR
jgi:hypothetical protein